MPVNVDLAVTKSIAGYPNMRLSGLYMVLTPDGRVLDPEQVRVPGPPPTDHDAAWPDLARVSAELGLSRRTESAAPVGELTPPKTHGETDLSLVLTSRLFDEGEAESRGTAWANPASYPITYRRMVPTHEWVALKEDQWRKLLPPANGAKTWSIDPQVASEMLWLFRPPTHNVRPKRTEITWIKLDASLVSQTDAEATVRLEGSVKINHPFYPVLNIPLIAPRFTEQTRNVNVRRFDKAIQSGKPPVMVAESNVIGYFHYDRQKDRIRDLQLVTHGGIYSGDDGTRLPFGVAERSVDRPH